MNADYQGEPRHQGESEVGHEVRNVFGFIVHLVCDINPESEFAHMIHDLEAIDSPRKQGH